MKKTLIASAIGLMGAASMAQAANVEFYGTIDTGVLYTHSKVDGQSSEHAFALESGLGTTSIYGLRGEEKLGDDLAVSFVLEGAFASDSGEMDDRLFGEEAQVSLTGSFGTLSAGRMGALTSGSGTYDLFMATGDSMDGGYADHIGAGYWMSRDIYNNMLTYATPEFAGFTGYVQYSLGTESDAEGSRAKDRYAALGLSFQQDNFAAALVVDTVLKNHSDVTTDDAVAVSFGMNYDLGFMKPFVGIQYGKNENTLGGAELESVAGEFDGYAVALGSAFPVCGGELQVSAYYAKGDGYEFTANGPAAEETEISRWGIGAFHNYELSKRTSLYVGLGYDELEVNDLKAKGMQGMMGLTHNF